MTDLAYCPAISVRTNEQEVSAYSWLDENANLNKKHYPNTTGGKPWVKYTEEHLILEAQLTPCAAMFWKWVLLKAPAGTQVEIDLADFRAFSSEFRQGKPYSLKQIKRATSQLESFGLLVVQEAKLKVLARHPGRVTNEPPETFSTLAQTKMSTPKTKSSTSLTIKSVSTSETLTNQEFQNAPDHTESFRSAADQEMVAAAAPKRVLEEPEVATPPKEEKQPKETQKFPRQERETQQPSESTHEGQCSAAQLETLKKLGIEVSRALKEHLYSINAETIDRAIAVFKQDRATWQGPPMENPAGYFRTVLRDVIEGRREPAPGLEHRAMAVDPLEEMLMLWRNRWEKLPQYREQFKREIAAEFPGGEIVVNDDHVGPVRGTT